jgi:hypothetical protein
LHGVYQDVIRWYHETQARQKNSFSLESFSHIIQVSFENHQDPKVPRQNRHESITRLLGGIPSSLPLEMFTTTAILVDAIFPIEGRLDNLEPLNIGRKDWICLMVDYLHSELCQESADALEQKLIRLDSVYTSFAMPVSSSFAYATRSDDALQLAGKVPSQLKCHTPRKSSNAPCLFTSVGGEFGIASCHIREDDVLCQFNRFREPKQGVILRRKKGYYMIVSKAIFFGGSGRATVGLAPEERKTPLFENNPALANDHKETERLTSKRKNEIGGKPTINIQLDAATLQSLTCPLKFRTKHQYREPLCVINSSFGWYEFVKFGIDTTIETPVDVDILLMPNTRQTIAHKHTIWNILPSKWSSIWSMVVQPFQQVWLLFRFVLLLEKVLHSGQRIMDKGVLKIIGALFIHFRAMNEKRITKRRRAVAFMV